MNAVAKIGLGGTVAIIMIDSEQASIKSWVQVFVLFFVLNIKDDLTMSCCLRQHARLSLIFSHQKRRGRRAPT